MEPQHTTGVSIHNGFPNASDDTRLKTLSLDTLLVPRPNSTYYFRIEGRLWEEIGIFDGDLALIDRALQPSPHDLVIWWHEDTFTISPRTRLPQNAEIWGVVTTTIHQHAK